MRNTPNGLRLQRISGSLGAEVSGVDLSSELDDHTIAGIRAGLLEHLVLVFRGQSIDPGSLAFWDNRATMHYAVDDFAGHRRVMTRVTLEGDRPR